jgi:hypothetical protein
MLTRMSLFRTNEAMRRGLAIDVRPDDVFVATYPKSGTTWLQQVVHGLRSGGSMDFAEISAVVPWLESAWDLGMDPAADQAWQPRAFKSHLDWHRLPKGGRAITALRDPSDVLVSFYRFFEGWFFEPGTVTLDEFASATYLAGSESGRHWEHIRSWVSAVDEPDVLVLTYEDMIEVPDRVPVVVADFLGIATSPELLETVVHQSSREFMARHRRRFDEHLTRSALDPRMGLPDGPPTSKVTSASADLTLSSEVIAALDESWRIDIAVPLGFETYDALRRSLPNPLRAPRR